MRYLKFLLISLIYFFILYLYLINDSNKHLLGIIFDSFGINCFTALYFLFLFFACKTTLNDKFFKHHKIEKSGTLYKLLGVRVFKNILAKNPSATFTGKLSLKSYSIKGLNQLENDMRVAETIHFQALLTGVIITIPFGYFRNSRFYYFMIIFNILVNFYPVLVQRYNRNRIFTILNRHI